MFVGKKFDATTAHPRKGTLIDNKKLAKNLTFISFANQNTKVLNYILLIVSTLSAAVMICGLMVSLVIKNFQYWPPPNKNSWQHSSFRWLFRGLVFPIIGLTVMHFEYDASPIGTTRYIFGIILLFVGFGAAFAGTNSLGWANAFGEAKGLKTTGWYAYSRNPIYVATWVGLIGWGLIANSIIVNTLLLVWGVFYIVATFLEEPWLEQEYGDEFLNYKSRVRRFL